MAFFSLWILGFVICALAAVLLWKQAVAWRACNTFRKQFAAIHRDVVRQTFDLGWMWLDIVLVFFVLSFASQSRLFAPDEGFSPEILTFLGIAIYCGARALMHWNEGQILFYPQGFVWKTTDIPYSAIRSMKEDGRCFEIATRRETILVSRLQYEGIARHFQQWKDSRKK